MLEFSFLQVFETPYIQATGVHYRVEAVKAVNSCSCSVYVEKVRLVSVEM